MSVKATGQITLVDLTDGQLSVYLSSNLPKTQIYNKKDTSFSPDWRETNLQIVPNVSLNQNSISLEDVTIYYKKLILEEEIDLDDTKEIVSNGILTVNDNLLNEIENKSVTYIAYLTYKNFSARADITFSLLNDGVDGEDGTSGESGYTFVLTNESYLFKGDNNTALNDYVNTTLSAYQGTDEQKIKIASVNGKTVSTESSSTGIPGLNFKISTISETFSPIITFTSTSELTQKNGSLPITFQVKGQTWTKFFTYAIALQGEDAISYWMINNTSAIKKNEENEFSPNQIILEAKNNTGIEGVSDYYARFLIEGTIDNEKWDTVYTSNQNEISTTYDISNVDYISYRCSMFLADNTDVLLDRQIIPIVSDGKTGIDGVPGKDGISTYFYVKYSANEDGSNMTDLPQEDTKFLGVCSTTTQTAPTSPDAYTWSEIKGKDGENGTPGEAGQDGQSSYLHIKYSNDGVSFTGNNGEDLGLYIGTLVDFNEQDSTVFADYTWKKFVGSDAKSLTLYSSTYVVSYDSYGKLKDEDLITLTAIQQNFEDEVVWTTNPEVTLNNSGLTRTLDPSVFNNFDKLTITITSSTFTDTITINKIADGNNSNSVGARSSNYDAIDKESAVFINGEKVASLITSDENRGHTLYTIDKDSLLLKSSKTYDTYANPSLATTLAEDILKIENDIIVIITCDASSVNDDLRNAFKSIGGLEKGTWNQQRVSQYIIGMPGIGPNKGYEQFGTDKDTTLLTAVPVIVGTGIVLNGTNTYTHIKYSNDGGKTFTHPDSIVSRDINDWISGDYNMETGIYEENPNRICIPGLIKVEKNVDYYFNTYNNDYKLILRIYDSEKQFVESKSTIENGGLSLITFDGYFGISLYSPTQTVTFEDYVKNFEEDKIIPTVCLETKSGMGDSKGKYFGVYYDNNSEDSTNPSSYVWNQITSDEIEIPEVTPPQNNYSVILTNESQTIYADNNGNVSTEEIEKIQSEVKVFNGSEECLTGTSGENKWEKIIWDNLKTESDGLGTDVRRCILPLTTKFTTDKIQLLSALSKISTTTIDDYIVPNSNYYMEGERSFYIGKITTYLYCSRDYNVTHKFFHDDGITLKINDKIIFYKGYYVFEDYVPLSFQKGYNKIEIYWTQWGGINGVGLYDNKLSTLDFVDKMDCYGYKHYDLSIKSQTPNIGAKINSSKTGFIATSIPQNVDSGNVILTVTMFDGTTIDKEFNWTKSKKGDTGEDGADGLTVVLTNENHSFPATTSAAIASSTSTKILAFKGSAEIPVKIKTVNGKTVSTTSIATGITGLNFSISSIESVNEPIINFSASTALTESNGTLPIVMEVNGQTVTKNFSFSLAFKGNTGENGQDGESAYLVDINLSSQIFKSTDGGTTFSPDTITLTPRFQNVSFGSWQYSTNGGLTWTTITNTTSSTTNCYYSASTKVLTIPKDFTGYTDKITSIVFKCVGSISTVYDTVTVAKLYDVTDLELGGRNLVLNSNNNGEGWINDSYLIAASLYLSPYASDEVGSTNHPILQQGEIYTISIKAKIASSDTVEKLSAYWSGSILFASWTPVFDTDYIYTKTFTANQYYEPFQKTFDRLNIYVGLQNSVRNKSTIYWVKIEKGNIPSDWTAAPEDIESELENKVEREHIKAAINASDEQVKIEATNVDLEGYVTITSLSGKSQTVIDGSNITTGVLQSANYNGGVSDTTDVVGTATAGMAIKLINGIIDTKNFSLDAEGNISLTGRIYSRGRALQMLDDRFVVYNNDNLPVMELKSNGQTFYNDDGLEISRFSYQTVEQNEDLRPIEDYDLLTGKTINYVPFLEGNNDPNLGMNLGYWVDLSKINNNTTIVYLNQEKDDSKLRIAFFKDSTYMYLRLSNGDTTITEFYAENLTTHYAKNKTTNFTISSDYKDAYAFYTSDSNVEMQKLIERFKNHFLYYGDRRVFNFNLTGETNNEFSWTKNDKRVLSIRTTSIQSLGSIDNINVFECNADLATIASTLIFPYRTGTDYGKYAGGINTDESGFEIVGFDYESIKKYNLDYTMARDARGIFFDYKQDFLWFRGWSSVKTGGSSGSTLGLCPHTLYDNTSGSNGTITLTQDVSEFDYLDIVYRTNDGFVSSKRVYAPFKGTDLTSDTNMDNQGGKYQKSKNISISGKSISTSSSARYTEIFIDNGNTTNNKGNNIYIMKVIGWV